MNKIKKSFLCCTLLNLLVVPLFAQQPLSNNWHLLDPGQDKVFGTSVDKAYGSVLKGKQGKRVVVAIIDSGIDTLHEDLKTVLWVNPAERANGKDNDGNGYHADRNGWNFLGNAQDFNSYVVKDSEEDQRIYFRDIDKFESVSSPSDLPKRERANYQLWLASKASIERKIRAKTHFKSHEQWEENYNKYDSFFSAKLGKSVYTFGEVMKLGETSPEADKMSKAFTEFAGSPPPHVTNRMIYLNAIRQIKAARQSGKFPTLAPQEYRQSITQDNINNLEDAYYGNANLRAEKCTHGTHVAGIIGAVRNNGVGIDGIADQVRLMTLRAVPDGDEHDKDIALAIRYAVDNGADIINMSFGKSISPNRQWVEDAIRYAEKKNVLIVKAAGNESLNIDSIMVYPTAYTIKGNKKMANVITVGASTATVAIHGLTAPFSNFGKESVDVFAPGFDIYSTTQGIDTYEKMSGTSMAAPVVTGIAALLKSYYPQLTAKQLKTIIEQSAVKIEEPVNKPGTKDQVKLSELCKTGAIVNAYEALKLAENFKP